MSLQNPILVEEVIISISKLSGLDFVNLSTVEILAQLFPWCVCLCVCACVCPVHSEALNVIIENASRFCLMFP